MSPEKKITIPLAVILVICVVGFLYTFVQPRYTATIVSVGKARTVSRSTRHGRKRHIVVPLVVTFTDEAGVEQTADVTYRWANGTLAAGQQIEIVKSFNGFIGYPFTGLRMFCGILGFSILVFLFFLWLDMAKAQRTGGRS